MLKVLFVLLGFFSLNLQAQNHEQLAETFEEYLMFADFNDGVITAEQIHSVGANNFIFIDVRKEDTFNKKHIKTATNIDWRQIIQKKNQISKTKPVVVYCQTGIKSSRVQFILRSIGYDNVRVLAGGINAWHNFKPTQKNK